MGAGGADGLAVGGNPSPSAGVVSGGAKDGRDSLVWLHRTIHRIWLRGAGSATGPIEAIEWAAGTLTTLGGISRAMLAELRNRLMKTYLCVICGFVYDEAMGLPDEGIAPGTKWEDVPLNWRCPECGAGKEDFEMVEV
jgi:rubredoxin